MAWYNVKNDLFPEKMLWLGVLRRAIFDYVLYDGKGVMRLAWKRARKFLFVDDMVRYEGGLTFEEICGLFGWDHEYIRRLIKKLTRTDVRKLESSRFKEEFMFNALSTVVEGFVRWDNSFMSAPSLDTYRYSPMFRDMLVPKPISRTAVNVFAPMVKWDMAA
jgi:hypothetical protein